MAEEAPQIPQSTKGGTPSEAAGGVAVDMEVETGNPQNPSVSESLKVEDEPSGAEDQGENGVGEAKREREEGDEVEGGEEGASKKPKVESSVEEERLEKAEAKGEGGEEAKGDEEEEEEGEEEKESTAAILGPKVFSSSVEMFDYFYKLLRTWSPNLNVNKYEHMVLLDLLKTGHAEPDKKIGAGIEAFQVRYHPTWKSRCFFILRADGSVDDFSFRKCVHHIIPLPENMKALSSSDGGKGFDGKKAGGHHKGGRGGGRWGGKGGRGRGRKGKF